MFTHDNEGLFPESGGLILWDAIDPITGKHGWMQQIVGYTLNTNIYRCPSDYLGSFSYFYGSFENTLHLSLDTHYLPCII